MRFYPQMLLWTYVLIPAVSLLLLPTFFVALARANQQRAKIMAHAMTARSRAAAALAKNQQRRFIPNSRFAQSYGQNRPYLYRPKRQADTVVEDQFFSQFIDPMMQNLQLGSQSSPIVDSNKPHSIETPKDIPISNNRLARENDGWNKATDSINEPMIHQSFGQPDDPPPKFFKLNNPNAPKPHSIKGVSDIVPPVDEKHKDSDVFLKETHWDQQEESLGQLQNMWNMNNFGRSQPNEVMRRSTHFRMQPLEPTADTVGEPHLPGYKKHQFDQKLDYYSGAFSGRNVFDDIVEERGPFTNMEIVRNERDFDESEMEPKSADPEPQPKKHKKKKKKKKGGHRHRSSEFEEVPFMQVEEIDSSILDGPPSFNERYADPEPTVKLILLKKLLKKLEEQHDSHSMPMSYYPPPSYGAQHYSPYYRDADMLDSSAEAEMVPMIMEPELEGFSEELTFDQRSAEPEPTVKIILLKKLLKKLDEQHIPYQHHPQSYGQHYSSYYRNADDEHSSPDGQITSTLTEPSDQPPSEERSANPEPTVKLILLKKLLKKLDEQHIPYQHAPSYMPPMPYGGSHYSPYYRAMENSDDLSEEQMGFVQMQPEFNGDQAPSEDRAADPQPTVKLILLKKLLKKLDDKEHDEHAAYPYPPPYMHHSYPGHQYPSYYRAADSPDIPFDEEAEPMIMESEFNGEQGFDDFGHRSASPDPKKKKKKKSGHHHRNSEADDDFMLDQQHFENGQRIADPEPTIIVKKLKKLMKKLDDDSHHHQFSGYPYSRYRSVELPDNEDLNSQENLLGSEQEPNNSQSGHDHKLETHPKKEKDFFYSSNFYEGKNKENLVQNKKEIREKRNTDLKEPPIQEEEINLDLKDKSKNLENAKNDKDVQTASNEKTKNPEDVSCQLDDNLFDRNSESYQRAVDEIDEQNKRFVEATKKLLHPIADIKESLSGHDKFSPSADESKNEEFDNIDLDQISDFINNNDQSNFGIVSQTHDRLKQPAEVKSADANADAHLHSHSSGHTHGHFKVHTHEKHLGHHQGIPIPPQVHVSNHQHQQSFPSNGFQQSQFGSIGNVGHGGSQGFSNGGFGHSGHPTGSFIPNGGNMHQLNGFQNGQFRPTGNDGNFGNNWIDPRGFSGNPGQFVNTFSGSQIVGQEHQDKTFVNPHLDKITTEEMHSEIDSDGNRFSRSQDNFQKGLGLASSIVDASLGKDRFMDKNTEHTLAHNPYDNSADAQNTMGLVKDIVDSGLEAGNSDTELLQKQGNLNPGLKANLPFTDLTSILNLGSTNLRNKRNDTHTEMLLENENKFFTNNDKISNKEGNIFNETKTDKNLDSLINTNIPNNSGTQKVFTIHDSNDTNIKESIIKHEEQVLNKNNSHTQTNRPNHENTVWIMLDPSAVASNPNILTDGSLPSTWGNTNKKVIYVVPNSKKAFTNTNLEKLPSINIKKDLENNNFQSTKENESSKNFMNTLIPVEDIENQTKRVPKNKFIQNDDSSDSLESTEKTTNKSDEEDSNESLIEKFERRHKRPFFDDSLNNQDPQKTNQENDTVGFSPEWNNVSLNSTESDTINSNLKPATKKSDTFSQENVNKSSVNLDSITPEVMPFLFHADGSRKNVSELTSEEIEELQFDIMEPKNGTKLEHSTNLINDNKKVQDDNKNEKIEVSSSKKTLDNFPSRSAMEPIPTNHFVNNLESKINLNFTGGPLSSMEDEMSVLTDEEKEEFIRQEMKLIAEVIEETLKHKKLPGQNLKGENITMNIDFNETKDKSNKETVVSQPNLFQNFYRDSSREAYDRAAKSENDLDSVLGQQRQKVEDIKQDASNGDDDLLMISFIGDSAVKDLENRRQDEHYQINQTNDDNYLNQTNKNINTNESNNTNSTDSINNNGMPNASNSTNKPTNTTDGNLMNRTKRDIGGLRTSRAPLTQLITDPTTKLDVKKTLQNLGNIARHTFENPKAPIYHMRNMLGNTKNSIMSAAKIPPNNFLIPSQYEISKISSNKDENAEKVGAVNQNMLASRSGFGDIDTEEKPESPGNGNGEGSIGFEDTFGKFGGIIRDSINTGKDTVSHVNDAATNARNAYYTTRQTAPRVVFPHQRPALASRSSYFPTMDSPLLGSIQPKNRKTVLITPKIFDLQDNIVGATSKDPDNFIGMGHLLDSAGISRPDQKDIGMQKIVFEPYKFKKNMFIPIKENSYLMSRSGINTNALDEINTSDNILGSEQPDDDLDSVNLQNDDYGMANLRKFMFKMHDEMKEMLRNQYEDRKKKRMQKLEEVKMNQYYKKESKYPKKASMQNLQKPIQKYRKKDYSNQYYTEEENVDENVEMTIPPEILQKYAKIAKLQRLNQNSENDNNKRIPTVQMNSRFQDLSGEPKSEPAVSLRPSLPQKIIHPDENQETLSSNNNIDEEKVALSLPSELMKPFMGQASENLLHEYMRENGDEEVFERESLDNFKNGQTELGKVELSHKISSIPMQYSSIPKLPKVPKILDLNIPTVKPLTNLDVTPILSNPGVVGAAKPQNTADNNVDLSEEKKEFVELLSKPAIDDTNLPEQHQQKTKQRSYVTPSPVVNETPINRFVQGVSEQGSSKEHGYKHVENTNNKHRDNNNSQPSSVFFKNVPLKVADIPDQEDLGYVLGAINPMMFERYFNERLKLDDTGAKNTKRANTDDNNGTIVVGSPQPTESGKTLLNEDANKDNQGFNPKKYSPQLGKELTESNKDTQQVPIQTKEHIKQNQGDSQKSNSEPRTIMFLDSYKKPFMGQIDEEKVHDFLKHYNNDLTEDDGHNQEEMNKNPQENYQPHNMEPMKNVVFLNYDDDNAN